MIRGCAGRMWDYGPSHKQNLSIHSTSCWLRLKCDGTRAETRFRLSAKRTSQFKSAWASVQSTTGSRGVRISDINAGYTIFPGSAKSTGYALHSPVSPSLPPPLRHRVPSHFNWTVHVIWLEWGSFHETASPKHVMLMTNQSFDRFPYSRSAQHFTDGHKKKWTVVVRGNGWRVRSQPWILGVHSFWGCMLFVSQVDSNWNVMAHDDVREGKWRGNWRMEWVDSTLHTTSELGVSNITTANAHTSAASSRLKWHLRRFKWTRPFRPETKSGFCACAITSQLASNCLFLLFKANLHFVVSRSTQSSLTCRWTSVI